jgi:hypothetical protein
MVTTKVPLATVHIAVSFEASVTVNDELAVGANVMVLADQSRSVGSAKVTVWSALVMVIDCVAGVSPVDEYVIV